MTEREILLLGFTKEEMDDTVCEDDSGKMWVEKGGYYYVYSVTGGLSFISSSSTESIENLWFVEIFNTVDPIRFTKFEEVQSLINKLEKAKLSCI